MKEEIAIVLNKITALTQKIKRDCPEIYSTLGENPSTFGLPKFEEKELEEFKDYLETLQVMYNKAMASDSE